MLCILTGCPILGKRLREANQDTQEMDHAIARRRNQITQADDYNLSRVDIFAQSGCRDLLTTIASEGPTVSLAAYVALTWDW